MSGNIQDRVLVVIPREGIGPLKLGMTPDAVTHAVEALVDEWALPLGRGIQVSDEREAFGFTRRYQCASFFFMVQFEDDHAIEIAVDVALRSHALVQVFGIDVFRTPAEDLVNSLETYCPCTHDLPDKQLSTNYEFPGIGIRLWREEPFHPKLLQDATYMDEMKLVIEDMYRYQYFEMIAVRR